MNFEWLATGGNTSQKDIVEIIDKPEFSAEELEILETINTCQSVKKELY